MANSKYDDFQYFGRDLFLYIEDHADDVNHRWAFGQINAVVGALGYAFAALLIYALVLNAYAFYGLLVAGVVVEPWIVAMIAVIGVAAIWRLRIHAVPIQTLYTTLERFRAPYEAIQQNEVLNVQAKRERIDELFTEACARCLQAL